MASWVDKLEKRFGRYAIENLSFWIMVVQIGVFGMALFTTFPVESLALIPSKVFEGEVWRLFTFMAMPPMLQPSLWLILIWYIFYFFGSTLEKEWGEFRFNLFILLGVAFTGIASLALNFLGAGQFPVSNVFLMMSVTLAFAFVFPNFEILVFFVLPVRMKWIAIFILAMWVLSAGASPVAWLPILAALATLAVFFGKSVIQGQQARQRR